MSGDLMQAETSIIPQPVRSVRLPGRFTLAEQTAILAQSGLQKTARYLQELLAPPTGLALPIRGHDSSGANISLRISEERAGLGSEGYTLQVTKDGVTLTASAPAGVFYAIQTLRQLLPVEVESRTRRDDLEWSIPCVDIEDHPRFSWRGYMLDEGRHFHGKQVVKRMLDLLALHKLNVFHWHLTDDQGWRIQIMKHPRLTEIGSYRSETQRGGFFGRGGDGIPHAGCYTQDDVKEIVAYAAERFITIVPEIEMPGHALAALAAYPELSCTGGPFEVQRRFGVHRDVFCAGKEQVFAFLQDVLDEIMALFPSRIIHVGGDEVRKSRWKACPDCRARIKTEKLGSVSALQGYFTNRISRYLASNNHRLMGWNQILNQNLGSDAVCQYWIRGFRRVLDHIRAGGDVVMSDFKTNYLDHSYAFTPLRRAYAADPVPRQLAQEHHGHILGIEALMWTEFVPNVRRLDWQTFPRLTAFAETGWSPKKKKDFDAFRARLRLFLKRLDRLGVLYAPLEETEPGAFKRLLGSFTIVLEQKGQRR